VITEARNKSQTSQEVQSSRLSDVFAAEIEGRQTIDKIKRFSRVDEEYHESSNRSGHLFDVYEASPVIQTTETARLDDSRKFSQEETKQETV
jgi:hypothetical protein